MQHAQNGTQLKLILAIRVLSSAILAKESDGSLALNWWVSYHYKVLFSLLFSTIFYTPPSPHTHLHTPAQTCSCHHFYASGRLQTSASSCYFIMQISFYSLLYSNLRPDSHPNFVVYFSKFEGLAYLFKIILCVFSMFQIKFLRGFLPLLRMYPCVRCCLER